MRVDADHCHLTEVSGRACGHSDRVTAVRQTARPPKASGGQRAAATLDHKVDGLSLGLLPQSAVWGLDVGQNALPTHQRQNIT